MNINTSSGITDIPRLAKGKDWFGIDPYEKALVKFITRTNTPVTIALQGEWGSGKTSLMNTLQDTLCENDDSKEESDNPEFLSIWLNTWEYSLMKDSQSALFEIIGSLIQRTTEIAKVDESQRKKLFDNFSNILKSSAKVLSKAALNKVADGTGEIVDVVFNSNQQSSIGAVRDELENIIAECIKSQSKKGFIFFIDDLDRLDPPMAVQLLELLKNIFTLKNCVFVLAIDYDVVVKGLEPKFGKMTDSNEREFRSFFDKIIQVPFSMPVKKYIINDFLKDRLMSIGYLKSTQTNDQMISDLADICGLSVGTNPRSLKRLLNSLSLISCINEADNEDNQSEFDELGSILNFALVSIQISYPKIYNLLNAKPGFTLWDDSVAIGLNLPPLSAEQEAKIKLIEEFDEVWEQTLYRFCEKDSYLKKQAIKISQLLNFLRDLILSKRASNSGLDQEGEIIKTQVKQIISLSSVTNIEVETEQENTYHLGSVLKSVRNAIKTHLKVLLPEIKDLIRNQGKRVQSNAYIKFTENDWGHYIKLYLKDDKNGMRLTVSSDKWIVPSSNNTIEDALKQRNLLESYNERIAELNKFNEQFDSMFVTMNNGKAKENSLEWHTLNIYLSFRLNGIGELDNEEKQKQMAQAIADLYKQLLKLSEFYGKTHAV